MQKSYARAHTSGSQLLTVPNDLNDGIALLAGCRTSVWCVCVCTDLSRTDLRKSCNRLGSFIQASQPPQAFFQRHCDAIYVSACCCRMRESVPVLPEFGAERFYFEIYSLGAGAGAHTATYIYPNSVIPWYSAHTYFEYSREAFAMLF